MKQHSRYINPAAFLAVIVALLALTGLSYGLSLLPMSASWELVIGLGIGVLKTLLVALFFMHLIEEAVSNQIALITAVAFVAILLIFVVGDVVTRTELTVTEPPAGWTAP